MEEKLQMIEYWDQMDYKNEEKKKSIIALFWINMFNHFQVNLLSPQSTENLKCYHVCI